MRSMVNSRKAIAVAGALAAMAVIGLAGCASESGDDRGIDPVGTWGDPSADDAAYLSLEDDGTLTGSDGCNRLMGSWELTPADQIQFDAVASTKMACEGVDTVLATLDVATISGTTMTVFAAGDAQIATLERTSTEPQ